MYSAANHLVRLCTTIARMFPAFGADAKSQSVVPTWRQHQPTIATTFRDLPPSSMRTRLTVMITLRPKDHLIAHCREAKPLLAFTISTTYTFTSTEKNAHLVHTLFRKARITGSDVNHHPWSHRPLASGICPAFKLQQTALVKPPGRAIAYPPLIRLSSHLFCLSSFFFARVRVRCMDV
jgi:hypothetical protein